MIVLKTSRQKAEAIRNAFLPYFILQKKTRLNNLSHKDPTSDEYLSALAVNCIVDEIYSLVIKKLVTNVGSNITYKFSDAQGVIFFKLLYRFPVPADQIWLQLLRNEIVALLEKEIIHNNLMQQAKAFDAATSINDYL